MTKAISRWQLGSIALLVVVMSTAGSALGAVETETVRKAIDSAMSQIAESLDETDFPQVENIAVVPLRGDDDSYASDALKSVLAGTHYSLFARSDETWEKLLAEIEWGIRREDIMDPETVQKFGKIQGVDGIIYGRLWDSGVNMWSIRGHVKVSVYLADVETGQVLWSSGPVETESFMHWSHAVTRFWRYPLVAVGWIIAVIILLLVLRGLFKAIKHANRPL